MGVTTENTDILIIGASAAGIMTAISARRYCADAKIVVIRRDKQVLIPCGIPYIFGTVGSPDKNLIPDTVLTKNNVGLTIDEVISINKDTRIAETISGRTFRYEKMVLATGSLPLVPPIPGTELGNVFAERKDVESLQKLRTLLSLGVVSLGWNLLTSVRNEGLRM